MFLWLMVLNVHNGYLMFSFALLFYHSLKINTILLLQYLFQLGNCVEIGIPMLLLVIGLSQVSDFV